MASGDANSNLRISRIALLPSGVAVVALLMLAQCMCGGNNRPSDTDGNAMRMTDAASAPKTDVAAAKPDGEPAPKPAAALHLPPILDTKDLDDDEKQLLQDVLSEQYDPCGKSRSFLESLAAADTCEGAKKLGAFAVQKVAQGLSKKQTIQELLKEQARWASKFDFDLTDSPHHGDPGPGKKVVIEFFDYQCPHCKLAAKPAKEITEKAGAVIYYKMLPLDIHPLAKEAALTALAAARQGKFFELHDLLFDNQEILTSALIRSLALKVGCDATKLDADLKDPALAKLLARDLDEATKARIEGTPTFYVDGYQTELDQLEATLKK